MGHVPKYVQPNHLSSPPPFASLVLHLDAASFGQGATFLLDTQSGVMDLDGAM